MILKLLLGVKFFKNLKHWRGVNLYVFDEAVVLNSNFKGKESCELIQ